MILPAFSTLGRGLPSVQHAPLALLARLLPAASSLTNFEVSRAFLIAINKIKESLFYGGYASLVPKTV